MFMEEGRVHFSFTTYFSGLFYMLHSVSTIYDATGE
jgi:hypothetical protein